MIKTTLQFLSPPGANGRLSVFIFHRVLSSRDAIFPEEPDVSRFDEILGWIKRWFNVLPLDRAIRMLKDGTLPSRAAAITFDDGYEDNYSNALPLLQKHGLAATFFIATGFLDGGRMWNDTVIEAIRANEQAEVNLSSIGLGCYPTDTILNKRHSIEQILGRIKYFPHSERLTISIQIAELLAVQLANDLMMTSESVRKLREAGMQIGGHTVSHPILAATSASIARDEISNGKRHLEEILGEHISLFAYPNGKPGTDYLPEHTAMVDEAGFEAAVSTAWGVANYHTDIFQIPRFTPWDANQTRFALRLMKNLVTSRENT